MSNASKSKMSSQRRRSWAEEFDRRMSDGGYSRRKMKGEWQVADDLGHHYWRNGNACCGCGRHDAASDHRMTTWNRGPQWS